jgi:hypothetical protein
MQKKPKDKEQLISVSVVMPTSLFWTLKQYYRSAGLGWSAFARMALQDAMDRGIGSRPAAPVEDPADATN